MHTHDFEVNQSLSPVFITIFEQNANGVDKVVGAAVKSVSIQFSEEDYVKLNVSLLGKYPESGTETFSQINEQQFTFGHAKIKFADTIADLATAEEVVMKSFDLNIENNTFQNFSGGVPVKTRHQAVSFNGNFERELENQDFRTILENNQVKAMQVEIEHSEVIEGSATKSKITLTFPGIQISDRSEGGGLDEVQTESFSFEEAPYNLTEGAAMRAQVVNSVADY